jgi:probable DNA metabolism protein
MQSMIHDGSFEGWLTTIFEIYDHGFKNVLIHTADHYQKNLFGDECFVTTDEVKATRVWEGLQKKLSVNALHQLNKTWLSEIKGIDNILLSYVQYAFSMKASVEKDSSHSAVLTVMDTAKKVHREKHRMEAFIRFQLTKDQLYYAIVEPDFNVLPLIRNHFKNRYADQRWMIYDARRKYGIYYDLEKVDSIQVNFEEDTNSGKDISGIYDEDEKLYQHLWKTYFGSVNIAARKNMKLHIQHMPRRYWKYLTEK